MVPSIDADSHVTVIEDSLVRMNVYWKGGMHIPQYQYCGIDINIHIPGYPWYPGILSIAGLTCTGGEVISISLNTLGIRGYLVLRD